jgi:hypothetical protein
VIANEHVWKIISDVRPYSMVPPDGIGLSIHLVIDAIDKNLRGDLVECGVWRGGCGTRATHDYLSQNDLPYRIQTGPNRLGAWITKQSKGRPVT